MVRVWSSSDLFHSLQSHVILTCPVHSHLLCISLSLAASKMRAPWLCKLHQRQPFQPTNDKPIAASSAIPMEPIDSSTNTKSPEVDIEACTVTGLPDDDKLRPNEDAQAGVKAAEAVTISWSRRALIAAFVK